MRVDLHLHTWVSDGDVSPTELVRLAAAAGLGAIAVTDHDTAAGVHEAMAAATTLPIDVIPGIEISTRWEQHELHILGYWIDPDSDAILEHQGRASQRRSERMHAMIERLQAMGIKIGFADVEVAAGPKVRTLGRPHLARALHAGGHTRFYSEAFVRFIGDSGPAFVAEGFPVPEYAIATIHAAGGLAVWAHPPLTWVLDGLPLLAEWGLDGIECYRPNLDPGDLATLESATMEHGLFPTGGSDWHGPQRFTLGDFAVDAQRVRHLLDRGGILS
jgi:3',5'-nucleoside bisphosphate phosphatase